MLRAVILVVGCARASHGLSLGQAPPAAATMASPAGAPSPAPMEWQDSPGRDMYMFHGTNWDEQQGQCTFRERQSPVNFDDHIKDPPTGSLEYHYEPIANVDMYLQSRAGMLFVDLSRQLWGGVKFNDNFYPLVRIDFHAPAEHLFKGDRHPLEIHLVHRLLEDPEQSVVLAVLVWCDGEIVKPMPGPAAEAYKPPPPAEIDFNMQLQHFLVGEPPSKDGEFVPLALPTSFPLDLSALVEDLELPETGTYIQYAGSYTAPPCLDRTTYFVRRVTAIASVGQVQALSNALYRLTGGEGNFRAVMPQQQRLLNVVRVKRSATISLDPKAPLPLGPNPRTDSEFMTRQLANRAEDSSFRTLEYVKDFSRRLRNSVRAGNAALATSAPVTPVPMDEWGRAIVKVQHSLRGIVAEAAQNATMETRAQVEQINRQTAYEADNAMKMVWSPLPLLPVPAPGPMPAPAPSPFPGPMPWGPSPGPGPSPAPGPMPMGPAPAAR